MQPRSSSEWVASEGISPLNQSRAPLFPYHRAQVLSILLPYLFALKYIPWYSASPEDSGYGDRRGTLDT
jgi:hypothetical protein